MSYFQKCPFLELPREGKRQQLNGDNGCCRFIRVNLQNDALFKQGLFNGIYTEQPDRINGHKYWTSFDRQLAIWYTRVSHKYMSF